MHLDCSVFAMQSYTITAMHSSCKFAWYLHFVFIICPRVEMYTAVSIYQLITLVRILAKLIFFNMISMDFPEYVMSNVEKYLSTDTRDNFSWELTNLMLDWSRFKESIWLFSASLKPPFKINFAKLFKISSLIYY